MKYIRIDKETNAVVEMFPYDPWEWIKSADGTPNAEFLAYCRKLPDDAECECGWVENDDGTYSLPNPEATLDELRAAKKQEIGEVCSAVIYAGVEVNGKHYSLLEDDKHHDQLELSAQYAAVKAGAEYVPYHADGELCRMYSAEEFSAVAEAATAHIFYHRTYANHLNIWIARAADSAEIGNIHYSAALPDDLAEHMANLLEQAGGGS